MSDPLRRVVELRRAMGQLEAALSSISDALVITSTDGRVLWCNAPYTRLVERASPRVLGESIYDQLPRDKERAPLLNPEQVRAAGEEGGRITRVLPHLTPRVLQIEWKPVSAEQQCSLIFSFRDISTLLSGEHLLVEADQIERRRRHSETITRELEQERLNQATKVMECPVTGLPNRRGLQASLASALNTQQQQGGQITILFCDLISFKQVHDLHGHQVGDDLQIEIGHRLQHALRQGDILSRLGSREFVVVTMGVFDQADALQLAMRLQDAVAQPWSFDDQTIRPAIAVGISLTDDPDLSIGELLRRADLAMHDAKLASNRQISFYQHTIDRKVQRTIRMRHQLENAIQDEDLLLVYQPIVDLRDLTITGTEALLRIGGPSSINASPSEFVPIAERTALILPIGRWVISEALGHLRRLRSEGLNHTMSINVSPLQLREPGLSDYFLAQVEHAGLDPAWTAVEVTEGILIDHPEQATLELSRLRKAGVEVHLDDFGTGYSSMSWLASLPIDAIKIDRSFTADFSADSRKAMVLQAMIHLSQDLGLTLIAEGIETEHQRRALLAMGCQLGQGYLFGRPEPVSGSSADSA